MYDITPFVSLTPYGESCGYDTHWLDVIDSGGPVNLGRYAKLMLEE